MLMKLTKINESDEATCKSVAKSITDILKFSFDEKFRSRSFKLFDVLSASQIENQIQTKLLGIINGTEKCCQVAKGRRETSGKKLNKETNVSESLRRSNSSHSSDSSTLGFNSCTPDSLKSAPKRSWLQISAEKYKLCVQQSKVKKLSSFSQPDFGQLEKQHETTSKKFKNSGSLYSYENSLSIDWGTSHCKNGKKRKFLTDSNEHLMKMFKSNSSCHF